MIDFHNMPSEAAGTLAAVAIRRDASGELAWDMDISYQVDADPVSSDALEHVLPGSALLVEDGMTRTRKVTVNDSTERDDVRLTVVSFDTGEEVVPGTVAEIRKVVLRVVNDVSMTTIKYRIHGSATDFAPLLQLLDARVSTKVDSLQMTIPFPSAQKYAALEVGDLVSGTDNSGALACGLVLDVKEDTATVQELDGLVVRIHRKGMIPPIQLDAPDYETVGAWVDDLKEHAKTRKLVVSWGDVVTAIGMSTLTGSPAKRTDDGKFIVGLKTIDTVIDFAKPDADAMVN
jgi:hypothetical protein